MGTEENHKRTPNLPAVEKYTKQRECNSTKNSLAPEHRTLWANLGNNNANLHKALNCTEISSVKTIWDTSTLTLL